MLPNGNIESKVHSYAIVRTDYHHLLLLAVLVCADGGTEVAFEDASLKIN